MVVNPIYDVARNTYNVFNKSSEKWVRERKSEREYKVSRMWVVDIQFRLYATKLTNNAQKYYQVHDSI